MMWQLLFLLIFIGITLFVIYPLLQSKINFIIKTKQNQRKLHMNENEILENEYNLGLIDQEQFIKEKRKLDDSSFKN